MKKVFFISMALIACISQISAQVTITFNPNKGEKYVYAMDTDQDIKQDVMGKSMAISQQISIGYDMVVTDKSSNETTVLFTYKDMALTMESPFMSLSYDSKNPPGNAVGMNATLGKLIDSILGNEMQVVIVSDGSVKSVSGMDAMVNKMTAAFDGDAQGMQMVEMMKGQLNDEAIKQQLEQSFKVYPPAETKVGESWDVLQSVSNMGVTIDFKSEYTLKSADGKNAIVDYVSSVSGMDGQMKGEMTGTIKFDQKTGMNESNSVQTMKGTVSANGMDIPMDITTKTKVSMTVVK